MLERNLGVSESSNTGFQQTAILLRRKECRSVAWLDPKPFSDFKTKRETVQQEESWTNDEG